MRLLLLVMLATCAAGMRGASERHLLGTPGQCQCPNAPCCSKAQCLAGGVLEYCDTTVTENCDDGCHPSGSGPAWQGGVPRSCQASNPKCGDDSVCTADDAGKVTCKDSSGVVTNEDASNLAVSCDKTTCKCKVTGSLADGAYNVIYKLGNFYCVATGPGEIKSAQCPNSGNCQIQCYGLSHASFCAKKCVCKAATWVPKPTLTGARCEGGVVKPPTPRKDNCYKDYYTTSLVIVAAKNCKGESVTPPALNQDGTLTLAKCMKVIVKTKECCKGTDVCAYSHPLVVSTCETAASLTWPTCPCNSHVNGRCGCYDIRVSVAASQTCHVTATATATACDVDFTRTYGYDLCSDGNGACSRR